jgi:hypothetical protein
LHHTGHWTPSLALVRDIRLIPCSSAESQATLRDDTYPTQHSTFSFRPSYNIERLSTKLTAAQRLLW